MAMRIRLGRNRLAAWRLAILFFLVAPSVLYLFLAYIVPTSPALIPVSLLLSKRPVLIVAHPDDESLFFGPTILALNKVGERKELRILVLSSGALIIVDFCYWFNWL
jgi:N-acetylglucosaminylphosphatidylinositol deacetylase